MSLFAAWLRRRQRDGAALLLYTLLAIAMMAPLAPDALPSTGPSCDICNHVSGIIEARNALEEGQFPVRVPPHQNHNERYALFQFYGNLPYTLGGALYLATDASPYDIWKYIVTGALVLGGFFTYCLGRSLTRQTLPALGAGVIFVTAPYLLTDIHGRVAYPEIISFTLLPVVFHCAWRCFAGRGLGAVLASGIAWCSLSLTHNITFFYGSLFLGLFFLSYVALRRRLLVRWLRVGGGYGLGLLLAAWYIVPQQMLVPQLCDGLSTPVQNVAWLTPLGVLLAPSVALPVHLGSPYIAMPEHFGLQVGWPILAAVGLALLSLRHPGAARGGRRAAMVRLLLLFGVAFFLSWSPVDVWAELPALFGYVQFSYRLLMFVVLFGSLLAAYALTLAVPGRMYPIHLAAVVLAAGWCAAPYLSPHHGDRSLSIDQEIAAPNIGRGGAGAYFRPGAPSLVRTSLVHPDVNWIDDHTGGLLDWLETILHGKVWAALPAPVAGDALRVEGCIVPEVQGRLRLTITVDDVELAAPELPPGPYQLTLPLPPAPGKERIRVVLHGEPLAVPVEPPHRVPLLKGSYAVSCLALLSGPHRPPAPKLLTAAEVQPNMEWGHPSVLWIHPKAPTLVQLPITYYPHVLRVELDGRRTPTRHLGRFVAMELPPGPHLIRVRFEGVRWANIVSLASWATVAVALVCLAGVRLHGSRKRMCRRKS
jgi:hypothetical protein